MNAISVIVLVFKLPIFYQIEGLKQYKNFLLLIITHPTNVVAVDDIDLKTKGRQRRWKKGLMIESLIIDGSCDCVTLGDMWLPMWQFQVPPTYQPRWWKKSYILVLCKHQPKKLYAVLLFNIFRPWELRVWDHIEVVFKFDSDWICKIQVMLGTNLIRSRAEFAAGTFLWTCKIVSGHIYTNKCTSFVLNRCLLLVGGRTSRKHMSEVRTWISHLFAYSAIPILNHSCST